MANTEQPEGADIFQRCVDLAAAANLEFVLIGGQAVNARGYSRTTIDFDFLIATHDLAAWGKLLDAAGYRLLTKEIKAFAQFDPKVGEGFRVDLMLVDPSTFAKLLAGSEWLEYGNRQVRVLGVLYLIALKLHALRSEDRYVLGKDFYDILNLIQLHRIDVRSPEFQEILNRHANDQTRGRLQRELDGSL